jgi:hypothetical protein
MRVRLIATFAMAATAAAIGLAPIAAAAPTGTASNGGGSNVDQSPGNAQIVATPGASAVHAGQLQHPFYGFPPLALHHQFEHHHH